MTAVIIFFLLLVVGGLTYLIISVEMFEQSLLELKQTLAYHSTPDKFKHLEYNILHEIGLKKELESICKKRKLWFFEENNYLAIGPKGKSKNDLIKDHTVFSQHETKISLYEAVLKHLEKFDNGSL